MKNNNHERLVSQTSYPTASPMYEELRSSEDYGSNAYKRGIENEEVNQISRSNMLPFKPRARAAHPLDELL